MLILSLWSCSFERLYCDEVEKCFPDEECAWAAWRDDPRCEGCERRPFDRVGFHPECMELLRARADDPTCAGTETDGVIETLCSSAIECPPEAPPQCTPGTISVHLERPRR